MKNVQRTDARAARCHRAQQISLLVADRDVDTLARAEEHLPRQGFSVFVAEDGPAAWEQFLTHRPDIVVSEVELPGLDGMSLLERIRERSPEVEVILTANFPDADVVLTALRKGAANFLRKPLQWNELLEHLGPSLARCRLRAEQSLHAEELGEAEADEHFTNRMATLGRLNACFAHEVSSPLAVLELATVRLRSLFSQQLKGGSQGVSAPSLVTEAQKIVPLLDALALGTRRLAGLVAQVQRFGTTKKAWKEPQGLAGLMEESLRLADVRKPPHVRTKFYPAADNILVEVDAVEFESCLVNLLVNAYEALDRSGGNVLFSAELPPPDVGIFPAFVEIVVEDDGPGIAQGSMERGGCAGQRREGMGLGLAIAREAAQRAGASVAVDCPGGRGTRVLIRMPYRVEARVCTTRQPGVSETARVPANVW